ncbi:hypothetical protein BC833DRAFT_617382 [Globomyces pollinis-pini]|nr:hypothetical protein BC833DRAFT_617382 [Globomyces pollinis-pini]
MLKTLYSSLVKTPSLVKRLYHSQVWKHKETPYQILNVNKLDDQKTIKAKYYLLAKQFHPDMTSHLSSHLQNLKKLEYLKVQDAYNLLKDPNLKHSYDSNITSSNTSGRSSSSSTRYSQQQHWNEYDNGKTYDKDSFQIFVLCSLFVGVVSLIISDNIATHQERELNYGWELHQQFKKKQGLQELYRKPNT